MLYTDVELEQFATPALVRVSMREALVAAWRRELVTPPRIAAQLADHSLSFSCGNKIGDWYGFHSFTPAGKANVEMVVIQDEGTGHLRGMASARGMGPRRCGGIGAVALEILGPTTPHRIGLIGAGTQAWHQLWALPPWMRSVDISVYCRDARRRAAFASQARKSLGLNVIDAESAESAVAGADCVILASSSPRPVLPPRSLLDARFVALVGPKQFGSSEFEPGWFDSGWDMVSDSPEQLHAFNPPNILVGTGLDDRVVHLGAVVAGEVELEPRPKVFLNVGLAGAEAWLLNSLLPSTA